MTFRYFLFTILLGLFASCHKLEPKAPEADAVMDAPIEGLTTEQHRIFLAGAEEFEEVYTSETGLGPLFVSNSCVSCHSGDNRGHPFTMLTRFGQTDSTGNSFLHQGAPQWQSQALAGHIAEEIPSSASRSRFIAPIVSGVGFLEAVPDADIVAMAAANASHPDGVRGHPNWVHVPEFIQVPAGAISKNGLYIGRFGRKASTFNLHQQTVQAFNQDMGITTTYLPQNPFNYQQGTQTHPTGDPDISDQSVNGVVFYLKVLQAPIPRNSNDAAIQLGKQLFVQIGCEACHKETLHTGASNVQALANKAFHPYTDLLVHDIGAALNDGYTEGSATAAEWRTTPLWGMGLAAQAQGGQVFLLHDGRAHSIDEAIRLHGGEANVSRGRYESLSENDRTNLIRFLESL